MISEDKLKEDNTDFYIKMIFIGYDILRKQATQSDIEFYDKNYNKFLSVEKTMITELKEVKKVVLFRTNADLF